MKKIALILLATLALGPLNTAALAENEQPARATVEATVATANVKGGVGRIYVWAGSSDAVFNVYSITGQLVKVVKVAEGDHATVELPKGFYIVRVANKWSRKVVVK